MQGSVAACPTPSCFSVCLTVSALWCGSGLVHILVGQGVLQPSELRASLVPGLAAFTLALLVIGGVAIVVKKAVLFLIAFCISLACAHQIAGLSAVGFGQSATAANYLLVCLVGVYFGFGRLLSIITHGKVEPPGTGLKKKADLETEQNQCSDAVSVCLVMNLLSASVLACPLLGVVPRLSSHGYTAATFYGFTAILRFAEGYSALLSFYSIQPFSPVPFPAVFSVLFSILAVFSCQKSLVEGLYQLSLQLIVSPSQPSLKASSKEAHRAGLFQGLSSQIQGLTLRAHDKELHAPHLGYSKYADAEVLGHACSVLAAFAVTATVGDRNPLSVLVLPWVVVAGGGLQLLCGSVAFARGKTFESTVFTLYGVMWVVWGLTRYGGLYGETRGFHVAVGIISFMLFNCLVTVAALFLNVAWFVYALTFQLILISFLLDAVGSLPYGYDIGVTIIFGKALVKLSGVGGGADVCPHVPARKASSVQQIAEIMKNGGICGMPTDTVYVLVAACNRPDAVIKAYKVKKQAEDRPMSLWISSIKQLEPVRHLLSPLLLDFMEAAWPSSISMVIPRGPWMDTFGLGDAAKHIGTPQSIAIRNPDCSVATHLINMVGPIAVTSANPTGEADTTHHNQVYAKLGKKVDGVLCDGPSPENIASTVVDCTKIETGHIGFFRVGLVPKSKVLQIFEEVQMRHRHGQTNPAFEDDGQSFVMEDAAESEEEAETLPSTVSPEQSPVLRN
ncbi:putative threonylcarbamoyl-AMP synthase [Dissostichus eleginoides]|uniref:Threonylcarbamoyl-AMP synthase n=1 Tax=Dissostichus eleginoides TaxID=100907 RepID=A0AAD9F525_DISEL|nr:putative threonylcarbamoyl-AMP synthase [Dissostichus eleginoides]